jgi:hypothetical protein
VEAAAAQDLRRTLLLERTLQMFGAATPYVVAICSLLFCGASALTLFHVVDHFDPPDAKAAPDRIYVREPAHESERIAV